MTEATNDPRKIGRALRWIVSLFDRYNIPYQICGGLAAKAYGATRPLVDIDFYAELQHSSLRQAFLQEIQPYISRAWAPWRSDSWDIIYLAMNYQGMQVEIAESSSNPRFYNRREGRWEDQPVHYGLSTRMQLYGVEVALMPKNELLAYKAMLDRDVDHLDIEQVTKIGPGGGTF